MHHAGPSPNPVQFFILLAGVILAATDNLTTWWGIVIVVGITIMGAVGGLGSEIPRAQAICDAFVLLPGVAIGVFAGWLIFDAWWGVILGAIVVGLLATFPAALLEARLERRY